VGVGGKGNEGVTALIKQSPGTVGYVEYGYAKDNGLSMASLQNKSGNFVAPDIASARSTLSNVQLPENLRVWPVDPEGANDYPIVSFTWLLLYKKYSDPAKLKALKEFVTWSLTDGQSFSESLGYVPLPEAVVEKSKAALATVQYPRLPSKCQHPRKTSFRRPAIGRRRICLKSCVKRPRS
jgi:phosphate transport system substrate-binding protein